MWIQKRLQCTTLVLLLEKWKASLDKHGYAGASLIHTYEADADASVVSIQN